MNNGQLSIVATPIGNLDDITARALETLKAVDLVLCEDTRETKKLLDHYGIKTPTLSYHHHSGVAKIREIIDLLGEGKHLALVTDAGTPGICDPGNYLVRQLTISNEQLIKITPIPGPSAVIAALSISGFLTDRFLFLGFPPHKKGRQTFFKDVGESEHTTVFYESNHRIGKCLSELSAVLSPNQQLCVCRELTKKFESIYRGTIGQIIEQKIPEKGEFVIVIS